MYYTNIINRIAITNIVSNFGEEIQWEWVQSEGLVEKLVNGQVHSMYPAVSLQDAYRIAFRQAAEY